MRKIIAINCRSILKQNSTGIGRYTYQLLNSLGEIDQENQYYLHAPRRLFDFKRRLPKFNYQNFHPLYDFFNLGSLKKTDIYHLPSFGQINKYQGRLVVTIHDLIHRAYPKSHTQETIHATESHIKKILIKADHIICISQATRHDLHQYYDFPQNRSSVVLNGVNHEIFFPVGNLVKQEPYILFVGTIEPRKNLEGALRAFALFRKETQYQGVFKIVGMKGWMCENIQPLIKQLSLEGCIEFKGFVSDDDLRVLYNNADVFIFPSFYEGFGFPILEAFACGTPVITSNTSSCAELAADAALTIDPNNIVEMARAIRNIITDIKVSAMLRTKGLARAKEYSFKQTAQQTLKIYNSLIH